MHFNIDCMLRWYYFGYIGLNKIHFKYNSNCFSSFLNEVTAKIKIMYVPHYIFIRPLALTFPFTKSSAFILITKQLLLLYFPHFLQSTLNPKTSFSLSPSLLLSLPFSISLSLLSSRHCSANCNCFGLLKLSTLFLQLRESSRLQLFS